MWFIIDIIDIIDIIFLINWIYDSWFISLSSFNGFRCSDLFTHQLKMVDFKNLYLENQNENELKSINLRLQYSSILFHRRKEFERHEGEWTMTRR